MTPLTSTLFEGFQLSNPLWIASAHHSDSENTLRGWVDYAPAAITLKTTAEKQRLSDNSIARSRYQQPLQPHKDPILKGVQSASATDFFWDGPKSVELLSIAKTKELLSLARKLMPKTKIGVSILMGEDYREAFDALRDADFAEFNLKYSVRAKPKERTRSFFQLHASRYESIIKQLTEFLETFAPMPVFVKLTRELPWLTPCAELATFNDILTEHNRKNGRAGIVLANTRQVRIPACWVQEEILRTKRIGEIASGILAGEQLFLETYNLVRTLKGAYPKNQWPIVASGGIMSVHALLELVWAGASVVQLCSAFDTNGLPYYSWLRDNLEDMVGRAGCDTFDEFATLLRGEPDYVLAEFRYHAGRIPYRRDKELRARLTSGFDEVVTRLQQSLKAEVDASYAEHGRQRYEAEPGRTWLLAEELGLPAFRYAGDWPEAAIDRGSLHLLTTRANIAGDLVASELERVGYRITRVTRSSELLEYVNNKRDWDFALLPATHLDGIVSGDGSESKPILLGELLQTRFYLYAFEGIDKIREVYHFANLDSERCLQDLVNRVPSLQSPSLIRRRTRTSHLVFLTLYPDKALSYFAKEPLASIYSLFAQTAPMQVVESQPLWLLLMGSPETCRKLGPEGLGSFYRDAAGAIGAVSRCEEELTKTMRGLVSDIIRLYLPAPFWPDS